jgi:hypothetical protein
MENLIRTTRSKIKADEPCIPRFYNHDIKGSCIGYASPAIINSTLPGINKKISSTISLEDASIVLDYYIRLNHKILTEEIGQFYNYLSDTRKASLISLCDLVGIDMIFIRFKTSFNFIAENNFNEAVDLIVKNHWTQQFYNKNKRLRNCLNDLRIG